MRLDVCKHYRGTFHNDTCEYGVNYEKLASTPIGVFRLLPCFADHATDIVCPAREFPTEAEVAEFNRWANERSRLSDEAYRRCAEDAQGQGFRRGGDSMSGRVVCPKCDGVLNYSIAGSNGHIWAQCETKGCLRWIQ